MTRALACCLGVVVTAFALASVAGAGLDVRTVDVSAYPSLRLTVVTSSPRPKPPTLLENGQPVVGFAAHRFSNQKLVLLAVDRSRSMRGAPLAAATKTVRHFLLTKPQADEVEIISFGSRAVAATQPSQAIIDGDIALRTLTADDRLGTALYDAVILAAADARKQHLAGRVLILLTDGRDLGSFTRLPEAVQAARGAGLIVYAIALGNADQAPLQELASATGGRVYTSSSPKSLDSIYARVREELSRTWRLSWATSGRPGEDARVTVGNGNAPIVLRLPGKRESSGKPVSPVFTSAWSGFAFAGYFGMLIAAAALVLRRASILRKMRLRVESELGYNAQTSAGRSAGMRSSFVKNLLASTDEVFGATRLWRFLDRSLERTGTRLRSVELVYISLAVGFTLSLLMAIQAVPTIVILFVFALGVASPSVVVYVLGLRRVRAFDAQLPDVLSTIAASLRAGHGLKHALQGIAEEAAAPAKQEFSRVLSEARLGRPLEEAMIAMCDRLGSADLEYVASAVSVQTMVGGSMAGLFDQASETVRHRQQHARKLRSLTATGRASATVLTLLPLGLAAFMTAVNPEYMLPFFSSSSGQIISVISLVMMSIGALFLVRVITIKE